jgi:hypothetical protein
MSKRKRKDEEVHDGKGEAAVPTAGQQVPLSEEEERLRAAVDNPGSVEIPETVLTPGAAGPVVEIPSASLDPEDGGGGEPLAVDPAVLSVELSRPGPQSWVQFHPDRIFRTVLLGLKPSANESLVYHYIVSELQKHVREHLKQVQVLLCSDLGGSGEAFLWLVLESPFSPYYNALMQILAKGDAFLAKHAFQIGKADLKKKGCSILFREIDQDDPEVVLPSRPIGQLLPEALKQDRLITSKSHPVFVNLMRGRRLV